MSYRGRHLGSVQAAGGRVQARGGSNLEAELHLDGVRVLDELVYLIQDLAKGSVPLDTVTKVEGSLSLIFAEIPVKVPFFFLYFIFFLFINYVLISWKFGK